MQNSGESRGAYGDSVSSSVSLSVSPEVSSSMLEGLAPATACRFKSCLAHHRLPRNSLDFGTLAGVAHEKSHRETKCRLQVKAALDRGELFIYNNGDPALFMNFANAFADSIRIMDQRKSLRNDLGVPREVAIRSIETVARAQKAFTKPGRQLIGGRPQDLTIFPDGRMLSDTGIVSERWSDSFPNR